MKSIKKAVIPAAGFGTRFLPASKSVPKEMFPLIDKPILLYIVEEAVAAGIEDIVVITQRGKSAIEDFFDSSGELEDLLEKTGKTSLLADLNRIKNMANIIGVRQKKVGGLGHAVGCAKKVVGDEPFAVLLGDEITLRPPGENTVTGILMNLYRETKISHVSVFEVEKKNVQKYGIIEFRKTHDQYGFPVFDVSNVVEKPSPAAAPSCYALPGRYVFDSKIFEFLANASPGKNGEIQLTDAMTKLAQTVGLRAALIPNQRFDAGDKVEYVKATVEFALMRPEMRAELLPQLQELLKKYGE